MPAAAKVENAKTQVSRYDADADHVPYGDEPCHDAADDSKGFTDDDGLPLGTENP
jgi:hypothetical protein